MMLALSAPPFADPSGAASLAGFNSPSGLPFEAMQFGAPQFDFMNQALGDASFMRGGFGMSPMMNMMMAYMQQQQMMMMLLLLLLMQQRQMQQIYAMLGRQQNGPGGGPSGVSQVGPGGSSQGGSCSPVPNPQLSGDDAKTAQYIDDYLAKKNSPAAGKNAGELMVYYGKKYDVDPIILLSICGQETQFGKTGIGVNGMMGVGAYDNDPQNACRNPEFSGVAKQIEVGAKTFAHLRAKGGSSSKDPISVQTAAVNRAGWATDAGWHNGVDRMYRQIANA
jgi:hypothetical protein